MSAAECCATCRFCGPFDHPHGPGYDNECRRHAPISVVDEQSRYMPKVYARWPAVAPGAWCGDYEACK